MLKWLETFDQHSAGLEFHFSDSGWNRQILEEFVGRHETTTFFSGPDEGIYDAWNKSLLRIQNEFVAFLGVTDRVHPGFRFEPHDGYDLVAYNFTKVFATHSEPYQIGDTLTSRFPFRMRFCFSSATFRREALLQRPFDATFKIIGDLNWLWKNGPELRMIHGKGIFCEFEMGGVSNGLVSQIPRLKEYFRISDSWVYKAGSGVPYALLSTSKIMVERLRNAFTG